VLREKIIKTVSHTIDISSKGSINKLSAGGAYSKNRPIEIKEVKLLY
jgi:hypothetical protein